MDGVAQSPRGESSRLYFARTPFIAYQRRAMVQFPESGSDCGSGNISREPHVFLCSRRSFSRSPSSKRARRASREASDAVASWHAKTPLHVCQCVCSNCEKIRCAKHDNRRHPNRLNATLAIFCRLRASQRHASLLSSLADHDLAALTDWRAKSRRRQRSEKHRRDRVQLFPWLQHAGSKVRPSGGGASHVVPWHGRWQPATSATLSHADTMLLLVCH